MHSLHDRQSAFAAALLDPSALIPAGLLGPDGRPSARRFGVYRNNVIVGLVDALWDAYPAVGRLVGREFFIAMARVFVTQHPPENPVLLAYGEGFAEFLAGFEPVMELVYLPDVARLERAWVESYHSEEAEPLQRISFESLAAEDVPLLQFHFHPSVRLISSPYPALTIWRANVEGASTELQDIDLTQYAAEDVLIVRPAAQVEVRSLLPGHARWMRELMRGETLLSATSTALQHAPTFDPAAALALLVESNALHGFQIGTRKYFTGADNAN